MFDITNIYFTDKEDNIIEPDENGSVNLLPYIHDEIYMHYSIVPMHALRCINLELPWYLNTSYKKIGKGMKHKHMFGLAKPFNKKKANALSFKCRLFDDNGHEVFRDCVGGKYHFRR